MKEKIFIEMLFRSEKEINEMCDSGMFNSIIQGYCLCLLDRLGVNFDDSDINTITNDMLDFVSAEDARNRYCKE